jgi:membrane associated rhomboid family serine protease
MARSLLGGLPKFGRGAFALLLLTAILSAIFADQALGRALLLDPSGVLRGEGVWQPLTANFIFREGDVGLVIGTLAVQWFVGSALEAFWGTKRYVALVVGCGLVGHLAAVAFAPVADAGIPLGGATAMDLAAIVAFGAVFGARPLHVFGTLPISARTMALIVVAISIVAPLGRGAPWPVLIPWLVAMLGALLVTTQPWRALRDSGKLRGGRGRKRKPDHLRVVRAEDDLLN